MHRNSTTSSSRDEAVSPPGMAKRIANWATNLLVSGVILIVGLACGRQVIDWWRPDAGPAREAASVRKPDVQPSLIQFGDAPLGLHTREVTGDLEDVLSQLREAAREAVRSVEPADRLVGPAERQLLEGTAELTPVERLADKWAIYQLERPLPVVIGIKMVGGQVAEPSRRVVSWGMATPAQPEGGGTAAAWKLFTTAIGTSSELTAADVALSAPPGGRRTLSLQNAEGLGMIGFRGQGQPRDWMTYYDGLFDKMAWRPAAAWGGDQDVWRRRFSYPPRSVEVAIHAGPDSSLHAILVMTSPTPPQAR